MVDKTTPAARNARHLCAHCAEPIAILSFDCVTVGAGVLMHEECATVRAILRALCSSPDCEKPAGHAGAHVDRHGRRSARRAPMKPSEAALRRWADRGIAKAVDGCSVDIDGRCPHGSPSWLISLGLI